MEQKKRFISSRTMILLIGAFLLCAIGLTGAIGATQAQLSTSANYSARIQQTDLGVAILEKTGNADGMTVNVGVEGGQMGATVSEDIKAGQLLSKPEALLNGDKQMIPGKRYDEQIWAKNVSENDEYVRMIIRKYWTIDGKKAYTIDSSLIKLGLGGDWELAEDNGETMVFYYKNVLPAGDPTTAVVNSISIDTKVNEFKNQLLEILKSQKVQPANYVGDETIDDMVLSTLQIKLEAEVEAVQTRHVVEAATSAWGVDVSKYWGNDTTDGEGA